MVSRQVSDTEMSCRDGGTWDTLAPHPVLVPINFNATERSVVPAYQAISAPIQSLPVALTW